MEEHALRRSLSDELHARAFHDFEGAGRFIRYVFLTETGTDDILAYIDEFLVANGQQHIPEGSKFLRLDLNGFAIRVEQHTEFLSVSFIEKGRKQATGLLGDAFDAANSRLPLAWARGIPAPVFHAIWLEIGGKPPRGINPEKIGAMMQSRAIASNLFSDGAAQLHFCLLYTSPSPRDGLLSRMPSSA